MSSRFSFSSRGVRSSILRSGNGGPTGQNRTSWRLETRRCPRLSSPVQGKGSVGAQERAYGFWLAGKTWCCAELSTTTARKHYDPGQPAGRRRVTSRNVQVTTGEGRNTEP